MKLVEKINQDERLYRINETESYSRERIINHMVNDSMRIVPEHWRDRNFEMVTNPTLKTICDKLQNWDFKTPAVSSIISTQNGIGKTFIATCLIRKYFYDIYSKRFDKHFIEWIDGGGIYTDCADRGYLNTWFTGDVSILNDKKLHLEIQETFGKKKNDQSQLMILDNYCKYKFLVIDDMFSNKQNEFARQNLLYIIDERCEFNNLPTFITSNLTLEEIADIDTRIADRINNSMLFQIVKPIESFRQKL